MIVGIALISATLAGGAAWAVAKSAPRQGPQAAQAASSNEPAKYVTLEKVVVMLRRAPGDSRTHYLQTDLVLDTSEAKAKQTKDELPLLRSLTVRTLSQLTVAQASSVTVDEVAESLNQAFAEKYDKDRLDKPFAKALVSKLIVD